MSRHAAPWSLWAMYRDTSARTHPGRHQANLSPTHVPAWPFKEEHVTDAIRDRIATLAANFGPRIAAERICDQFIIIDREELPEVSPHHEKDVVECDKETYYIGGDNSEQLFRKVALRSLAVAEYAQDVEHLLKVTRRDELAQQFAINPADRYVHVGEPLQKAINRIIELEQAQP